MVGSGTTLVEAVLSGRQAIGADIDPLARLIAKTKATPLKLDLLQIAIDQLLSALDREHPKLTPFSPSEQPSIVNFDYWFTPEVARDLALLKRLIAQADINNDIRDFFYIAFSSLIVARTSVANARDLVHSRHHYRLHPTPPDVPLLFRRRLRIMQRRMSEYVAAYAEAPEPASSQILCEDARSLSLLDSSVSLIFTSPPYCNALDYTRAHTFSVAWLADVLSISTRDYVQLGRRYIGSDRDKTSGSVPPAVPIVSSLVEAVTERDSNRGRVVSRYFSDMEQVIAEAGRILQPAGHLVLVICPSHIRKVEIPTHRAFVEIAAASNTQRWTCVDMIERTIDDRRRLLPYMQSAFGHRMKTEYVVVLQKEASLAA
jgi:hypothetical protein